MWTWKPSLLPQIWCFYSKFKTSHPADWTKTNKVICKSFSFWTLSIVYISIKSQRFGSWIFFRLQVKRKEPFRLHKQSSTTVKLGIIRKLNVGWLVIGTGIHYYHSLLGTPAIFPSDNMLHIGAREVAAQQTHRRHKETDYGTVWNLVSHVKWRT
jgi:hypothetical protein